jgi:hypothetical protein
LFCPGHHGLDIVGLILLYGNLNIRPGGEKVIWSLAM